MARLKVSMVLADERDVVSRYDLPNPYFGSAPSALLEGLEKRPDVEVHIIACVRQQLRVPERLADNVFFHAVQVSRLGFLRTAYLPCIFKVRRMLRTIQPDIVHGQGTERYQGLVAAYSGFPNLITIHGNMRQIAKALGARPFSFHWFTGHLEPVAIRRTAGVICLSHHTYKQVREIARKTWIVPNAVQSSFFEIQRDPSPKPIILCVANIAPYKNQNFLMRTLDPIVSKIGLQLIFLGRVAQDDPYGQEFLSLVSARPWCVHVGFETGEALRKRFRTAQMLILPTLEDNCPMVVLEAMAAGLPVSASSIGGIPDLISNQVNGLLFDPDNPEAVRKAVTELLSDNALSNRMAKTARDLALKHYHPGQIADKHVKIYEEMRKTF